MTQRPTQEQDDQFDTPASGWKREGDERVDADEPEQSSHSEVDHLGNPKTDPDPASFSEDKPADIYHGEKPVEPDQRVSHDGESGIPVASQTFEQFLTDQNQQASKEHENTQQPHRPFETPPPMAVPPPDAVLPDEMLALLNSSYPMPNNGRVVREDHMTFASSRSDQLPPVSQGNLPQDDDENGSDDDSQQPSQANDAQSSETGSQEDRNVDSREQADHIDDSDWDSEKLDLRHTETSQLDQSEDYKPLQDRDVESKTTTSDTSTEQLTSDPGQSSPDSDHSDSNQQNEEKKMADTFDDDDDDYYDDHYWDDVPEPEYTGNDNSGLRDEPELSFEQEEEEQQKLPLVQEVSEERGEESEKVGEEYASSVDDGDGSSGDSQGQTQSLPSSDNTQSDTLQSDTDTSSSQSAAEASPSEAPPTEAPPSVVSSFEAPPSKLPPPPVDVHHSEFGFPPSSDAQPDDAENKSEGSDPSSASIEDITSPLEGQAPSPDAQPSGFDPLFEAETDTGPSKTSSSGTEAPSTRNEASPLSQSDGGDHQQVDTDSRLDARLSGVNDINLQSVGIQPSNLHPSPSVAQFRGGDGEQPNTSTESEKDNRLEQEYTSSRLPSEEQKQETKDDEHHIFVDGTHLPDDDDDDDDDVRTTPFQSAVFTQSVVSTPIPSSDSTGVSNDDGTRDRESRSLDEIKADLERLRAQWENDSHQSAPTNDEVSSNTDSHTVQGTAATDPERAGVDSNASSAVTDQQSGARQEDSHTSRPIGDTGDASSTVPDQQSGEAPPYPRPVEDTPYQEHVSDRSEPVIDDGVSPPPPYDAYEFKESDASREDTPTLSPMDADLAFEEPPPPPHARGTSYSCRDDYLAMPGHDRGGWMSYHEQVRARVRDFVLDALPKEWSDWVCHNVSLCSIPTIL